MSNMSQFKHDEEYLWDALGMTEERMKELEDIAGVCCKKETISESLEYALECTNDPIELYLIGYVTV